MANFTKLNGYDVEDSTARSNIETLGSTVEGLNENVTQLYNMGNYSTSEVNTHQVWIDGKTIYRKIIHVGAFPNDNDSKVVYHNIPTADYVVDNWVSIKCIAYHSTNGYLECNPYYIGYDENTGKATYFEIYVDNVAVNIDRHPYDSGYTCPITDSYVILEYTKTENPY